MTTIRCTWVDVSYNESMVSFVTKRYMRGVAEMKFSSLFVQISIIAPVCLVRFGEENGKIIDVI